MQVLDCYSSGLFALFFWIVVAYVKYDKASCAALAMESLNGAVLNEGRGPKLKVMLADAPVARYEFSCTVICRRNSRGGISGSFDPSQSGLARTGSRSYYDYMLGPYPSICRGMQASERTPELEISSDSDNVPPRSRLFIVVPKQADVQQIQVSSCLWCLAVFARWM